MASIKVLLRNKANKENKYPIVIRIIKDRKPSYLYTGHYIEKSEWDENNRVVKKNHPNSTRLNNLIAKKIASANATLIELETEDRDNSSTQIKKAMISKKQTSFFSYADNYLINLKEKGKYGQYSADKPRVKAFKSFLGRSDIGLKEINVLLLNKFKAYLLGENNVSERTAINHLVVIRTIFNLAIKDKAVDSKYYPFGNGGIRIRFPQSIKIGLTREEVKAIEDVNLAPGSSIDHARDIWLFSFYLAGMRVSDVLRLKWNDIKDNRLIYAMGKNNKVDSLKLPNQALDILGKYESRRNTEQNLIFPYLTRIKDFKNTFEVGKAINSATGGINKQLKKVAELVNLDKNLTMHIARHTFGNISGDKISVQMLQKLYRHTSITTTIGYQANFIHKDVDEALDAVLAD